MVKYDKICTQKNDEFQMNCKEKHHKVHRIKKMFSRQVESPSYSGRKKLPELKKPVELGHSELGDSGMK